MPKADRPFADVSPRLEPDRLELEVLAFWETEKIFEKSLAQREGQPLFSFYDGPPYATGKPHYGHILQSAIKDTVLRHKTMQGYFVPRRVGWDTHGLPIEVIVEKELGFTTKKDIEAYGIEQFNQKCRERVTQYIDEFTQSLKRLGRWADYEGAYYTLDRDYMETEWWVFQQLWNQGLVVKDFRSTPYCIRCATPLSNHEVGMGYKEKTDEAVYVKLRVKLTEAAAENGNLFLLIWTTTPWTLPANVAVAIQPELEYVSVRVGEEELIISRERMAAVVGNEVPVTRVWTTEELTNLEYEPLYTFMPALGAYRVVVAEHVTAEEGTGLVHMAPAFGPEDAAVGKREGLPILRTVDTEGRFVAEVQPWAGEKVFAANPHIAADLEKRGLLFRREHYTHNYPHCWRCDEPLIYYALDTWFIRVTALKDAMLAANEKIAWIPEHVKRGRFGKGLAMAPDWAVSRNRFWSVPLPIWECEECTDRVCVGSVAELQTLAGREHEELTDLHRPYVDQITWSCKQCGSLMRRVPEVLDVWFDSGSMPYAQWHYPFANKELVERGFPADFIVEAIEMTRAWFYFLHVLATALTRQEIGLGEGQPAFSTAIASGLIFAEDGRKLSKKLKNYPEPEPVFKRYGADILRLYLLASARLGEPYRFSEKDLQQMQRKVAVTLWNVYSFLVRYANIYVWTPAQSVTSDHVLDRWISLRLAEFEQEVIGSLEAYRVDDAARAVPGFIDDLSNWYVRRSRERFQPAGQHKQTAVETTAALSTLYTVLVRMMRLLAPLMPFMTETIYRNLTGEESVHLAEGQKLAELPRMASRDVALLAEMKRVRQVVAEGLALRARAGIKVRQPLAEVVVLGEELPEALMILVQDELNVQAVRFIQELPVSEDYAVSDPAARVRVALNISLTPELEAAGIAREIIRHGQVLRRTTECALDERIELVWHTESAKLAAVFDQQCVQILTALQADAVHTEIPPTVTTKDVVIAGEAARLGIVRQLV